MQMTLDEKIEHQLKTLTEKVEILSAEADIRRIISRYMLLCDVPLPELGVSNADRIGLIVDLFSDDATWEGVGPYYENQFGFSSGREGLIKHFTGFFQPREPEMLLNCHYLTSEHITVTGDRAEGKWVHFQPWIFSDGSSVLRSSRLFNAFKKVDGVWKMSRYRTENVFIAPLPSGWAENIPRSSTLMNIKD
ncbi:nuclear transport factor 2 family protein [Chelatococcus asaccharovorans]|uniref:nuclear transport factor 2 family protein n=1 Tax=Chelatococcus asaccharovorans TaxID=28210 RepID=UPI00224C75B8|nr:nuclear transport factor 2 family protein [Chelatococcus asaccharovorans]CAH1663218.1 SnoaL-like protein [Chelatococcus asaccharovorans]CAH1682918.1 SnoaL-like protein [Chelatococcus asaccharovorans]